MRESNFMPLYSIVIPCYNAISFLEMTLKSIYAQSYKNFEVIVVDDGSTDGSAEWLDCQVYSSLRVIHQERSGVSVARNRGINEARGEFVAFVDADDCWKMNHLEIVNCFFKSHPEYNWFVASYSSVDDISLAMINSKVRGAVVYKGVNWFLSANRVPMSANFVMRKSAIPRGDFFPPGLVMCEDNVACAKMALVSPMIGTVDCKTVYYRMHKTSASHVYSFTMCGRELEILPAFLAHQSLFLRDDCSQEGKLFFRFYSLLNWWLRIRSRSMWAWRNEVCIRRVVTGRILTGWLLMWCFISEIICRIVGKIIRFKINKLEYKMRVLSSQSTVTLETVVFE